MAVYGYTRVSTDKQDLEKQKHAILEYSQKEKIIVDQFISVEISSRKEFSERKLYVLDELEEGDIIIVAELSRLARSISQMLDIVNKVIHQKKATLISIKENMRLDVNNVNDISNKVILNMFSLIYELERDFISNRTKSALNALKAKGVKLGKPKGTIQSSQYDEDIDKIIELMNLGLSASKITKNHLQYGTVKGVIEFIKKRTVNDENGQIIKKW